jgi:hypothetical protein
MDSRCEKLRKEIGGEKRQATKAKENWKINVAF